MPPEPLTTDRAKAAVNEIAATRLPRPARLTQRTTDSPARSPTQTDAGLVRGSADEFAVLFDRYAGTIHQYIARRIGPTEADDLLGQTFLLAFERRNQYQPDRPSALPWLYGIATNLIRRRRRDEVRQYRAYARAGNSARDAHEFDTEVAARLDATGTGHRLSAVLARLRSAERDVLLLYAWEELSYPEIVQALDIPSARSAPASTVPEPPSRPL